MTIVIAILVFCVIIIVHECGHFFAAKACGMKIDEFAIGMGPKILQVAGNDIIFGFGDNVLLRKKRAEAKGSETVYCIRLLPIGGSVSLGEDEDSDDPRAFRNKPVWQRMIVISAGAIMNLILGLAVCIVSTALSSHIITTTIGGFYENSASASVLQAGDRIVNINGLPILTSMDISYSLQNSVAQKTDGGDTVTYQFTVMRDGVKTVIPEVTFFLRGQSIALDFYVNVAEKNAGSVLSESGLTFLSQARLIWISLMDMVTGKYGLNDLSGPVGVVQAVSEAASSYTLDQFLSIVAFITINVGIFNLLPIPALDGARFLFLVIEAIRRKPVKAEYEGMVHFIGFAALMLLMIVITFSDIRKLIG